MKQRLPRAKGLHWKYWLRITFAPALARLGRSLGAGWFWLGKKLGREVLIGQLQQACEPVSEFEGNHRLKVVFLTMIGGNQRIVTTEIMLGRALAARGHEVTYILCDQALPACEVKMADRNSMWTKSCAKCYEFGRQLLSAGNCQVLLASSLREETSSSDTWDLYVEAALLKHYRVGRLDEHDVDLAARRREFQIAARKSAAIGESICALAPDRVMMSHGIYCTWGPAREILCDAGIPVVTYAEGTKKETIRFNWHSSADCWDVSREWDRVKDTPLTNEQSKQLEDYLQSRRAHSRDSLKYNFGEEEPVARSRRRLSLDDGKLTFVLFTNVLWDAASAQREIVFNDSIDWVMQTIQWFVDHPEKQLVIKIHPAEVVIGTNQPFGDLIERQFPELPTNVKVIRPQEEVNSWSIMQVGDLGLVHTSTVGLELPLMGIPCAVVSQTHYRERGFTIDVGCKKEYFDLLESFSPGEVDCERLKVLSRRYSYLVFERYQLPFSFLEEIVTHDVRAFKRLEASEIASDAGLELFASALESGADFLQPVDTPLVPQ